MPAFVALYKQKNIESLKIKAWIQVKFNMWMPEILQMLKKYEACV